MSLSTSKINYMDPRVTVAWCPPSPPRAPPSCGTLPPRTGATTTGRLCAGVFRPSIAAAFQVQADGVADRQSRFLPEGVRAPSLLLRSFCALTEGAVGCRLLEKFAWAMSAPGDFRF